MTEFEIGYLMGLIVGEGSFTGDKNAPALSLKLQGGDPLPLLELQRLLGGTINGPYNHDNRIYRIWQLRGPELIRALPLFDRYLPDSRKREQYLRWKAERKLGQTREQRNLFEVQNLA